MVEPQKFRPDKVQEFFENSRKIRALLEESLEFCLKTYGQGSLHVKYVYSMLALMCFDKKASKHYTKKAKRGLESHKFAYHTS